VNILTFDIEDWFHILENDSTKTTNEWLNYEPRIYTNMEYIFEALDEIETKLTFFCLGWITERYPDIIRVII
jgi:peptidoglycan/xylan/chitin deacetylase (PgdA/CDA1 family)